jgi:hypothetical protein
MHTAIDLVNYEGTGKVPIITSLPSLHPITMPVVTCGVAVGQAGDASEGMAMRRMGRGAVLAALPAAVIALKIDHLVNHTVKLWDPYPTCNAHQSFEQSLRTDMHTDPAVQWLTRAA